MKALVAFGTKWGSTEQVAEEIASVLRRSGHETDLADLRAEHDMDLASYDLVVVGSGVAYGAWSKGAIRFLEKRRPDLAGKRLAMFACCGDLMFDPVKVGEYESKYLQAVADKHGLKPSTMMLFGGLLDFSRYSVLVKGILSMKHAGKKDMEERGIDPNKPYDFRDWEAIREWAEHLGGME